jgi:hypothetical protein
VLVVLGLRTPQLGRLVVICKTIVAILATKEKAPAGLASAIFVIRL